MKRIRLNLLLGGSVTTVFGVAGFLAPGCEAVIRDPQTFFVDNPCNVFNCDNLLYLDRGNDQLPNEENASAQDAPQ